MWIKTSSGERPADDENVLVCWKESNGKYSSPHRGYYVEEENHFFSLENNNSHPLIVDMYLEISDANI